MYEELEATFRDYLVAFEAAQIHQDEIKLHQQRLDTAIQSAHAALTVARSNIAGQLSRLMYDVPDGKIKPALLRLSPEQMIVAVDRDTLWVFQDNKAHLFGPADTPDGVRRCSDCADTFRWDEINLAVIPATGRPE